VKVYIAGPYTEGDVAENIRQAIITGEAIAEAGHTPFIPHLYHFWHLLIPHGREFWMRQDKEWLEVCGAMIRINGNSVGADAEEVQAEGLGVPIYYSVQEFLLSIESL